MSTYTEEFFDEKRPWSRIKDQVLGSYMSPYIAKIATRGQPLLLIDAFAGRGRFGDGTPGSPLIMCQAAEKYARGKYQAIFVNEEKEYHEFLDSILEKAGWRSSAIPILGDSRDFLRAVVPTLRNQSVFLYLDPFGLKDCEFDALSPLLNRDKRYSTEIVVNISAPILHRLAGRDAILNGTADSSQMQQRHELLTRALGGDYWKEALLADNGLDAKSREHMVIDGYRKKLSSTNYLAYTGACPIQATRDGKAKYYMVFASPHPDAMYLFNDSMCKAFNEYMHKEETENTLFAGQHWSSWRDLHELEKLVVEYLHKYPNGTRKALWLKIITDHFMRFTESEYKKVIQKAIDEGKIQCTTPYPSLIRKTKKLNDDCVLAPLT